MKRNEGVIDRVIRVLIAIGLAAIIYFGLVSGTWAIVLGTVAGISLITGIVGFCGLYPLLGISTCPMKKAKKE